MEERAVAPWDKSRDTGVWNLLTNPKSKPITIHSKYKPKPRKEFVTRFGYRFERKNESYEFASIEKINEFFAVRIRGELRNMEVGEERALSILGQTWKVTRVRILGEAKYDGERFERDC